MERRGGIWQSARDVWPLDNPFGYFINWVGGIRCGRNGMKCAHVGQGEADLLYYKNF